MCKFACIFVLTTAALAQTTTPNLGMALPAHGAPNWDTQMNRNFTTIDNIFGIPSCGDGGHAIGWDATGKVITCQAVNGILGSPASSTQAVGNGTIFVSQPKPRFDVRDYGVTGNGSDESTQLQNAINAACSSAGASAELVSPSIAISVASTVHFTQCKGI